MNTRESSSSTRVPDGEPGAQRVAIITGAAGGMGMAIARALSRDGARVVLQDVREQAAAEAAGEIEGNGGIATAFGGDIGDPAVVAQMIEATLDGFGRVDILVNNAGFQHVAPLESFPLDVWQKMLDVQLTAPFLATQAVLPHMKRQRWGRIINMSSINGKIGSAFKSAYCTVKHGLIGLTRVTAIEAGEFGITANAICPGYTDTAIVRNQLADLARNHNLPIEAVLKQIVLPNVPQKRILQPEEIAECIAFLCSDRAFAITGQAINVSGGFVMH